MRYVIEFIIVAIILFTIILFIQTPLSKRVEVKSYISEHIRLLQKIAVENSLKEGK